MTPNQVSKKSKDTIVYSNVQDQRKKQQPIFKLGDLVRTADIKRVFSNLVKVILQIGHTTYTQ